MASTHARVFEYVEKWKRQGYGEDIPDDVPHELMRAGVAPSYKEIAMAILKNDTQLLSLGYTPTHSKWYSAIKRVELRHRGEL